PRRILDRAAFGHVLPIFTQETGIAVSVLAVGSGQALDVGRRGEADVVFVHAKIVEQQFIAEGHGVKRFPVMYDDFVLIGPKTDPAGIKGMTDVAKALKAIKDKQSTFLSRGDRSGTHLAELAFWNKDAGIDIQKEKGPWYKSINQGMEAALNMASEINGYTLADLHLDFFQAQGRPTNLGGRRPTHVQPVQRHTGEPGRASEREEGVWTSVYRLAGVARRAKVYRQLQD